MLLIHEIKCGLDDDLNAIKKRLLKKCKMPEKDLLSFEIVKKSIDARKEVCFIISAKAQVQNEKRYLHYPFISIYKEVDLKATQVKSDIRPIVIGYGPAGIFATLRLLEAGLKPIVFERGKRIEGRAKDVEDFFNKGILNPESNVQFGEGGAGTFSDAKLTTRVKNPFIDYILDTFIHYGANPDIKIEAHSHIGTDHIRTIISNLTNDLQSKGVEYHFEECVSDFIIEDQKIIGVKTNSSDYLSPIVILAMGHSAYDTAEVLYNRGVFMKSKDLAIGFRVEHPQSLIDNVQYKGIKHPSLKASEYFLRHTASNGRGVYSFCMCPGGYVVPSSSDPCTIVTNGMSYHDRASGIANSALLCQITTNDYKSDHPLAGFDYIKKYERKAYALSNSYKALAQNISDFKKETLNPLHHKSSYSLKTHLYDFNDFFEEEVIEAFKEAFDVFDRKIPGFIQEGIMVGPETRSSSPIRIERDLNLESINTKGLYPSGEGSGYGGGIVSCALDGIRVADAIIKKLSHNSQ